MSAPRPPLLPLFSRDAKRRGISLAGRIILINSFAMLIMAGSLLYFGRYMGRMIGSEGERITRQAEFMTSALSPAFNADGSINRAILGRELAQYSSQNDLKVLVFSQDGQDITPAPQTHRLPVYLAPHALQSTIAPGGFVASANAVFDRLADILPYTRNLPSYPVDGIGSLTPPPHLGFALKGKPSWQAWRAPNNLLVFTAAAPIGQAGAVHGAVVLAQSSRDLTDTLRTLRSELIQNFAIMLGIEALLALYMAQTMARPLRRLARAARRAQAIAGGLPAIPDYSARKDEIGELSTALSAMTRALWERLDATERFAADVAHELKNPLSSMKSALETLGIVKDPAQRQKLFDILADDVTRMDRLISDISSASRLEAELSRTSPESFNFVGLVSSILSHHATSNTPIDLKVKDSQLWIYGIPSRLAQVIENLIGNALSFSPPDKRVILRLESRPGWVVMTVDDDGPGIAPGKESRIFERFYSERPHQEAFGTHSGLGLSISRQIVEGHGGRIYALNRKNEDNQVTGARFVVELPRQ